MFCAYTRPRYQVSLYRTIGPLVFLLQKNQKRKTPTPPHTNPKNKQSLSRKRSLRRRTTLVRNGSRERTLAGAGTRMTEIEITREMKGRREIGNGHTGNRKGIGNWKNWNLQIKINWIFMQTLKKEFFCQCAIY